MEAYVRIKPLYLRRGILLSFFITLFLVAGSVIAQTQRVTLMQYAIEERPLLAELLTTAGLAPTLSGSTAYTLLVPPEEALRSLKTQPHEKIRAVLAMHIIKGNYKAADFKEGAQVRTCGGEAITVYRKKGVTLLNGVSLNALDRDMRNGVVQELNGLLQP
ncbi:fasciclin domain-containing protein [Pontibacter sp. JH31]|uniref:Fasciclin domain-containing protein n=1 Tax=Pontibacter aquaedesilientis TaxID=2766980 RepID=A0ABR7XGQ4_9BACT|nr:fasciclin domain-containing protein [Pontibacter aquaedesilientis]MBD1397448.1 fasciclin domain-containing protein [Pontibacter aquaedesilientis]